MAARTPVLDKTDLFGTLPPGAARAAARPHRARALSPRRHDLREGRAGDAPVRGVLGPDRHRGQGVRRPRVGADRARTGRCSVRCRCSTAACARRTPAHSRPCTSSPSSSTTCATCSSAGPKCCGRSCASSPAACARPTRRSPTRCSSTSPAAPPSGCSSWPTARTTSACRSPKRSWPAWSARRASG